VKIKLSQSGGIVGGVERFDLNDAKLTVSSRGEPPRTHQLSDSEQAKVTAAATRLLAQPDAAPAKAGPLASDSMLTEIHIGESDTVRRFKVASGQDAPDELWDLVDALSDAAKSG
jgi:hypothetical protein